MHELLYNTTIINVIFELEYNPVLTPLMGSSALHMETGSCTILEFVGFFFMEMP